MTPAHKLISDSVDFCSEAVHRARKEAATIGALAKEKATPFITDVTEKAKKTQGLVTEYVDMAKTQGSQKLYEEPRKFVDNLAQQLHALFLFILSIAYAMVDSAKCLFQQVSSDVTSRVQFARSNVSAKLCTATARLESTIASVMGEEKYSKVRSAVVGFADHVRGASHPVSS
jgi:polyhydroxyalkanoate synthesis regulator phasin